MAQTLRFTVADLEHFPEDGKLYEVVDGELLVSTQPDLRHQTIAGRIFAELDRTRGSGLPTLSPGVIFADDTAVAPDVAWISRPRLASLDAQGHLHVAPELIVEILSPGAKNEQRDREVKLKLYSQRGVIEYWIVDWRQRQVEVYQRQELVLRLVATLFEADTLRSAILAGFRLALGELFADLPEGGND